MTRDYVTKTVHRRLGVTIELYREAYWWAHQDLYVIAKRRPDVRANWLVRWAARYRRFFRGK